MSKLIFAERFEGMLVTVRLPEDDGREEEGVCNDFLRTYLGAIHFLQLRVLIFI